MTRRGARPTVVLAALLASCIALPIANAEPPAGVIGARGFSNSAARCDGPWTPVVAGRTALSQIVICEDARGAFHYRGVRLRDGALLELPAQPMANGSFGAHTADIGYTVSKRKLLLTAGLRIVRDEMMLEYKDFRSEVAPISKTSG